MGTGVLTRSWPEETLDPRASLPTRSPGSVEWVAMRIGGVMRLRTLWDDVAACILLDIPGSLRLGVFIVCLLMAYATGILWAISAGYQVDTVRSQARGELMEIRMHVRQLWGAYEALRTRQDRQELQSPRDANGLLTAEEREREGAAETEAVSDAQETPEAEWPTVPVTSPSRGPSRTLGW